MSAKFEIFLSADHQYYFRLKASNRKKLALSVYENSNQPPLSRQEFIRRLIFHAGLVDTEPSIGSGTTSPVAGSINSNVSVPFSPVISSATGKTLFRYTLPILGTT